MAIKLVAMDLDETLLGESFQISARNHQAIRQARELGVKVTIATGRMYKSCLPYARELNLDMPFATYHGAMVKALDADEPLIYHPVEYEMAKDIVAAAEKFGYHINLYLNDNVYIREENRFSELYKTITSVEAHAVGSLANFLDKEGKEPPKLTIIDFEGHLEKMEEYLEENCQGRITITKSHRYFLEITDLRATKGQAIKSLAEKMGIEAEEVMTIGDSYNDIDMLQYAGLGVAVSNARDKVKENADVITGSHLEDGVAEALEKYVIYQQDGSLPEIK